ncbi:hypothetical protein [Aminobacter sp. AP02]|uniref:hypothetical protein n=1 Tax=Aminobacter sp. AP02 TaxID=2135737 RepID=UPI000D6BAA2E|nr:hypothetical protein [Aminobacter sp. AP02]PWK65857.1 hypothetical protein C8K44_11572 [Aminobacter sp. AP02]
MFQKLKQPLIFAVCVWALLAFTAAQSSSTCGAFFTGDCLRLGWQRLSHVVLLGWVEEFQTLIAGIAALGAGAFVIVSGREQIQHLRESKQREKIDDALDSVYTVGADVGEYYRKIRFATKIPASIPLPPADLMKDIAYISPQLSQFIIRFHFLTSDTYDDCQINKHHFPLNKKYLIGSSLAMFQIFKQVTEHVRETPDFKPRATLTKMTFDSDPIIYGAEEDNLEQKHLGAFQDFFSVTSE